MRCVVAILFALLCPLVVVGSPLGDLADAIGALGRYEVCFTVIADDAIVVDNGEYMVDGDRYVIKLAGQEIYGDGSGERCSIDHLNKEVVLERVVVDESTTLIVVDPTKAFAMLEHDYDVVTIDEVGLNTTFLLQPKVESSIIDSITISIDKESKLPTSISYRASEDVVDVLIVSFAATDRPLAQSYPDSYELIDIR